MLKRGENRPILFEIILIIIAFLAAGVITAVGGGAGMHPDLASSIGRIFIALLLFVIFRGAFRGTRVFGNPVYVIPALLFIVWNLYYNLSGGAQLGGMNFYIEALITAMAPALFEEVIFRGIFIHNLRAKGYSNIASLLISALIFAAAHLTNIVGQSALTVGIQFLYSLVVGLVLAAIYLRNRSIVEVIIVHFLIDFFNRIYIDPPTTSSYTQIAIFGVLLAAEAVYAIWLTRGIKEEQSA